MDDDSFSGWYHQEGHPATKTGFKFPADNCPMVTIKTDDAQNGGVY